ncbi:hypothetical protein TASIC1_0006038600 [Trichoderma asperellum]|uniref:Uncharacterized protein n=1 Tax=Trichoderma asperellum TaxID=101201 RepID=A0A6V8QWL7_TRIAP|nr:hypothetical protein TASIC1_0006038600 [Trichoderma asperellum]
MLVLPTALLALVAEVAANQPLATAIKKQLPDANEKLFPDHLAFEPQPALNPFDTTVATNLWLDDQEDKDASSSNSTKRYHPAFSYHFQESEEDLLKRAADVLINAAQMEHTAQMYLIPTLSKLHAAPMELPAEEELAPVLRMLRPQCFSNWHSIVDGTTASNHAPNSLNRRYRPWNRDRNGSAAI